MHLALANTDKDLYRTIEFVKNVLAIRAVDILILG